STSTAGFLRHLVPPRPLLAVCATCIPAGSASTAAPTPWSGPTAFKNQAGGLVFPGTATPVRRNHVLWGGLAKGPSTVQTRVRYGGAVFYAPSVLNPGAPGTFVTGGAKFTAPSSALPEGWGFFISGEVGHWFLGTTDNFYCTQPGAVPGCTPPYPNGIPYRS